MNVVLTAIVQRGFTLAIAGVFISLGMKGMGDKDSKVRAVIKVYAPDFYSIRSYNIGEV